MTQRAKLGWPNRITISRILLIVPFVLCLLNLDRPDGHWLRWIAIGTFFLMAISDALDGLLARWLNAQSDLGKFLDPVADKLLITCAVIILAVVGVPGPAGAGTPPDPLLEIIRLPNWVAVAAIAKDLFVCIGFGLVRIQTGRLHIEPRLAGKACTGVQLLMILAMLLWSDVPAVLADLPVWLWYIATALAAAATFDYLRAGARLLVAGRIRPGGN